MPTEGLPTVGADEDTSPELAMFPTDVLAKCTWCECEVMVEDLWNGDLCAHCFNNSMS